MAKEIKKSEFLNICKECMSEYASKISVLSAIGTMSSIALSKFEEDDVLPEAVVDTCLHTLFERVRVMKKDEKISKKFELKLKKKLKEF